MANEVYNHKASSPSYVDKLSDTSFLHRYDVFFLDVWGTLSNGVQFFPKAIYFLNQIIQHNKQFIFVSNASRLSSESRKGYASKGLPDYGDQLKVVTAGQTCMDDILTGQYGQKLYAYGKAVHLPTEHNQGITYTNNLDEADAIFMAMCNTPSEQGITPHQPFLDQILARKLPIICANADQWVFEGNKLYMCSGYIARHYQKMGGLAKLYGKPEKAMFDYAHALCGLDIPKNRILMIGDSFETDIQGAQHYGIDSCVVLTGLYERTPQLSPTEWLADQSAEYNNMMPTYWSQKIL